MNLSKLLSLWRYNINNLFFVNKKKKAVISLFSRFNNRKRKYKE